jgi:hypothetical protein
MLSDISIIAARISIINFQIEIVMLRARDTVYIRSPYVVLSSA